MATSPRAIAERLLTAQSERDMEAILECVSPEYRSETPLHPARNFSGRGPVLTNWETIFETMPDYEGEFLRVVEDDDTVWAEVRYSGTRNDGTEITFGGIYILGVADNQIEWGRIYLEPIEEDGETWHEVIAEGGQSTDDT